MAYTLFSGLVPEALAEPKSEKLDRDFVLHNFSSPCLKIQIIILILPPSLPPTDRNLLLGLLLLTDGTQQLFQLRLRHFTPQLPASC